MVTHGIARLAARGQSEVQIYRFLNASNQIHHRYTAEVDARNCMYNPNYGNDPTLDKYVDCSEFAGNWLEEGYGVAPAAPVMCGPAS